MRLAMIALGATVVTACAMAPRETANLGPPPSQGTGLPSGECFRASDMRNHTLADDRTLLFRVDGKGVYRVTVDGSCLAAAVQSDPLITRQPPGSSYVCKPLDLDLGIGRNGFESRCIVQSITKMTDEQVAALPPRLRP